MCIRDRIWLKNPFSAYISFFRMGSTGVRGIGSSRIWRCPMVVNWRIISCQGKDIAREVTWVPARNPWGEYTNWTDWHFSQRKSIAAYSHNIGIRCPVCLLGLLLVTLVNKYISDSSTFQQGFDSALDYTNMVPMDSGMVPSRRESFLRKKHQWISRELIKKGVDDIKNISALSISSLKLKKLEQTWWNIV